MPSGVVLKPCPFCGSQNVRVISSGGCAGHGEFYEAFKVSCRDCKASGGSAVVPYEFRYPEDASAKAIDLWENRDNRNSPK